MEQKKIHMIIKTKEDYQNIEKDLEISYIKRKNGVSIKIDDEKRFIENGYKEGISYDDFETIHFPLLEKNINKSSSEILFNTYGIDRISFLDSNKTIFPIWFIKK